MTFDARETAFLENQHSAAMITVGPDGQPKVARCGVALVEGRIWSSGTEDRVRTRRLRHDPRCTLFVFDPAFAWLALEGEVRILEGPDAAPQSLRLFRVMQGRPTGSLSWFGGELTEEAFLEAMVAEHRLIYELEPARSYGLLGD